MTRTLNKKKTTPGTRRPKKSALKAGVKTSVVFMERETYKAHVDGLMAQGLDRQDAVDTLKVGIREANGRPVPPQLLANLQMPAVMAA